MSSADNLCKRFGPRSGPTFCSGLIGVQTVCKDYQPEDILACLDFRQNPDYDTADEQQDDDYGADSLDYDDGSKAQWTEEDVYRSQIKDEIKNRLWPDGSTFPME